MNYARTIIKSGLLVAVVAIFPASLMAQNPQQSSELFRRQGTEGYEDLPVIEDLRLFEWEMGFGLNLASQWEGMRTRPGTNFFLELRLNRPEPWDVALQLGGANFRHVADKEGKVITTAFNPSVFVDYNYRPSRSTRFFAGIGFGGDFAGNKTVLLIDPNTGFFFDDNKNSFSVTPRVGVSVFNFLRVTTQYTISARGYSRFGLNIGVTFGGSYRSAYVDRRSGRQKFWEDTAPAIINSVVPNVF